MFRLEQEPMSSTRFREAILAEHDALRGLIDQTLDLADGPLETAATFDELRARARRLYEMLGEHMAFEERMLPVALRDVVGWGETLRAQIAEDHDRQRGELSEAASALAAETLTFERLADELHSFAGRLLRDMQREEAALLVADVDAALTDAQGG